MLKPITILVLFLGVMVQIDAKAVKRNTTFPIRDPPRREAVSYILYTPTNPYKGTKIDPNNPKELLNVPENITIWFYLHAWRLLRSVSLFEVFKFYALSSTEQTNYVVMVDWLVTPDIYILEGDTAYNSAEFGYIFAEFLANLKKKYSLPIEKFWIMSENDVKESIDQTLIKLIGETIPYNKEMGESFIERYKQNDFGIWETIDDWPLPNGTYEGVYETVDHAFE